MSTSNQNSTLHRTWFERMIDWLYRANMSRAIGQFRVEAPTQFHSMITNLDTRLDPTFETLVVETLKRRELVDFRPSHVLLPRMMRQFRVDKAACTDTELKNMGRRCDQCEHISQCWLSLRANENQNTYRRFCPNAEALIAKA